MILFIDDIHGRVRRIFFGGIIWRNFMSTKNVFCSLKYFFIEIDLKSELGNLSSELDYNVFRRQLIYT